MIRHRCIDGRVEVVCPRCGEWGRLWKGRQHKGKKLPRYKVVHNNGTRQVAHGFGWTNDVWDELDAIYRRYGLDVMSVHDRRMVVLAGIERELREAGGRAITVRSVVSAAHHSIYLICPRCGRLGTLTWGNKRRGEIRIYHNGVDESCYIQRDTPAYGWLIGVLGGLEVSE